MRIEINDNDQAGRAEVYNPKIHASDRAFLLGGSVKLESQGAESSKFLEEANSSSGASWATCRSKNRLFIERSIDTSCRKPSTISDSALVGCLAS